MPSETLGVIRDRLLKSHHSRVSLHIRTEFCCSFIGLYRDGGTSVLGVNVGVNPIRKWIKISNMKHEQKVEINIRMADETCYFINNRNIYDWNWNIYRKALQMVDLPCSTKACIPHPHTASDQTLLIWNLDFRLSVAIVHERQFLLTQLAIDTNQIETKMAKRHHQHYKLNYWKENKTRSDPC